MSIPKERPKKTTREMLLAQLQNHARKKRRPLTLEETVDLVVEAAETYALPYVENDWTGGELLHQLRLWRKVTP